MAKSEDEAWKIFSKKLRDAPSNKDLFLSINHLCGFQKEVFCQNFNLLMLELL